MKFSIRGGLGFQLLGLIGAWAVALENSATVSHITLNFGNYPEGQNEANIDFLSQIVNLNFSINSVMGTEKFKFFDEENLKLVFKHLPEIRRKIIIRNHLPYEDFRILHVRQRDRFLVEVETYKKIFETTKPLLVLSDDSIDFPKINLDVVTNLKPGSILDWYFCYRSKEIYGGFSSFTLSAALLNPKTKLYVIRKEDSVNAHLVSKSDWNCMNLITENMENIKWLNISTLK